MPSTRTTYKGKKTTFSSRKLKSGKTALYIGGKRTTTKHQNRLVRSLLRQKAAGLTPTVAAARGHTDELTSRPARRRAFYKKYDGLFLTMPQIRKDPLLSEGTILVNGKKVKSTWAAPWKSSKIRTKYRWYAIVNAGAEHDENGRKPGSPDDMSFFAQEDDPWESPELEPEPFTIILYPESADDIGGGFLMDDVIDGFEHNLIAIMQRHGFVPFGEDGEEVDVEDTDAYLLGLFRHRRSADG